MTLSKVSETCKQCQNYSDCDHKRMEMCRCLSPTVESSANPVVAEMAVKHDYRDVKIAENTTVTIDLEELKKKLEEEIYKQLGCGFLREG